MSPREIGMSIDGLDLTDERWTTLVGGYRVPYDPRDALHALETGEDVDGAWEELWQELHHQGDIGEVAFAAIPHLVRIYSERGEPDWNIYALAAIIELARHSAKNPKIPADLLPAYQAAWQRLIEIGLRELKATEDATLAENIIGALAIGKGLRAMGRLAILFDEDERLELIEKLGY